jgi:hypothetical protein
MSPRAGAAQVDEMTGPYIGAERIARVSALCARGDAARSREGDDSAT